MPSSNKTKTFAVAFLVSFIAVLVFLPALENGFVNFDDNIIIYDNPAIRSLDANLLKYMFSFKDFMWIPLTRLSHALDYAVWELNPAGHHFTNIILHALNTFLVVILVIRLMEKTRAANPSSETIFSKNILIVGGLTGILFGIHPLRVESVVWVTERKDVLSGFFMLLSLIYYLKFVTITLKKQRIIYYISSLIFFFMASISKPMVVTLPVVLIILDIYPLERLKFNYNLKSQIAVIAEKVSFFALSLILSIVTIISYHSEGMIVTKSEVILSDRLLVAVRSICFYLSKLIWPANLAPYYAYPSKIDLLTPEYIGSLLMVSGITSFCIHSWKKEKVWSAVWIYFIITLLPVLGIMKFSNFVAADRYTYLPSLGPSVLVSLGIVFVYGSILKKHKVYTANIFLLFISILMASLLSILTIQQTRIWKDSITLWNFQMMKFPDSHQAHYSLGLAFWNNGYIDEAIKEYKIAIKLKPYDSNVHYDLGLAYYSKGNIDMAITHYEIAIKLNPDDFNAHNNLGVAYKSLGLIDKAFEQYQIGIKLNPDDSYVYNNLGRVYESQGLFDEAIENYKTAIRLEPKWQIPHLNLERIYAKKEAKKDMENKKNIFK